MLFSGVEKKNFGRKVTKINATTRQRLQGWFDGATEIYCVETINLIGFLGAQSLYIPVSYN